MVMRMYFIVLRNVRLLLDAPANDRVALERTKSAAAATSTASSTDRLVSRRASRASLTLSPETRRRSPSFKARMMRPSDWGRPPRRGPSARRPAKASSCRLSRSWPVRPARWAGQPAPRRAWSRACRRDHLDGDLSGSRAWLPVHAGFGLSTKSKIRRTSSRARARARPQVRAVRRGSLQRGHERPMRSRLRTDVPAPWQAGRRSARRRRGACRRRAPA